VDPITIGLAFTAAQAAVGHIKEAIALGKDIGELAGEFSSFFKHSDDVHRAATKEKMKNIGKSDAELGKQALEFAIHSNKLRQDERALKDMIIWELGMPEVWNEMLVERNRLMKERAEAERIAAEEEAKRKKELADNIFFGVCLVAGIAILIAFLMGAIQIYGSIEEQRKYEAKQEQRARIIHQQNRARQLEEKQNAEKAAREGG